MAEAREPLAGTRPDGVGRCGVGIRRLPGSFYGEHAERRHRWHGHGRYRRSRPVPPGLEGDDGSDDGARYATPDTPLPYHRPQPFEPSVGAGWRDDPAPGLYSGVGLSRATSVRVQLVGRCYGVLGGAMVCLAAHHRRGLPVHAVKAHLPRSVQQPIVVPNAQLALGSYRRSASGDTARRRVPGLLRRADGGLGGSRDDEPSLDHHSLARPLGVVMVGGGVVLLATSLLGGMASGME